MNKVTQEECVPGTKIIVHDKMSNGNESLGARPYCLHAHDFNKDGYWTIGTPTYSIQPGTILEVVEGPKKRGGSNQIRFKILNTKNPKNDFSSYWSSFKSKVKRL